MHKSIFYFTRYFFILQYVLKREVLKLTLPDFSVRQLSRDNGEGGI